MKIKNIITVLLIALILASCAPASIAVPTGTAIPTSTFTPAPTATTTITPTPVSYIEGLNNIPMPESGFIEQVVSENYLKVMGLTREQVNLVYVEHIGINGQSFVVMVDKATGIPMAFYNGIWQNATLKFFGEQVGIVMGTATLGFNADDANFAYLDQYARGTIASEWFREEQSRGQESSTDTTEATEWLKARGVNDYVVHVMIYPINFPDWLLNGNFSQEQLRQIMQKRIEYVINQNPNASTFVVVNEPSLPSVPDAFSTKHDIFYTAWGNSYGYIVEAFQMARDYAKVKNRDIKLIFNDQANNQFNRNTSYVSREVVRLLSDRGLIDYLGMEMHLNQWGGVTNGKIDNTFAPELEYYKKIGVPILITELTYEPTEHELQMKPEEFNKRLAGIFGSVFRIALESNNVKGITFWGLTDKYLKDLNWYQIFDENGQPKQSYYIVLKTLYEGIK